ncbi:MAG TPA: AAA family ATPase [Actinomycetota bacterium]|nr:AAA family ATPase [Actinomycetota bacterium]
MLKRGRLGNDWLVGVDGMVNPRIARADVVGRAEELSLLESLLKETADGSGGAAILEGEPGIGKSRIVEALCDTALSNGSSVYRGTGQEFGVERPFGVIWQALEGRLSRNDDRQKIAALLEDAPTEFGADRRFVIIDAIEDAFEHEAQVRPVLLSIDDAHWADASSILTLHALAQRRDLKVLLLVSCRPVPRSAELKRLIDDLTGSGSALVTLRPLDDDAVAELARVRLGSEPGDSLKQQLRRAGGNPLFVLELLEGLSEEDMLRFDGDLAEAPRSVQPPPSLRALIIRRLSFMDESSVELLRTAAVLGDQFSAQDLATVTGTSLTTVLDRMKEPIAAGVIDATEETFSFQHDVVREALYGDVATAVRKGLHLHIGRVLAASGASKIRVAHHVSLGAELGDREAVTWMREAALAVGPQDPNLAVDLLDRAADLLPPDDPERDGLLLEEILRLMFAGRLERASDLADELRRRVAGTPLEAMVDTQRLGILSLQFRVHEMARLADQILENDDLPEDLRMQTVVASAASRLAGGDIQGAKSRMAEARAYTESVPDSTAAGLYLWLAAALLIYEGRFTQAAERLEQALPRTEMFLGGRGQGLDFVGYGYTVGADDVQKARTTLEQGRAELEHRGALSYVVEYHWLRANLEFAAGNWDDALVEMSAANDLGAETGTFGVAIGAAPDPTILIRLFRGDPLGAMQALQVADGYESGMFVSHWLEPIRALVEDASGDRPGALSRLRAWHRDMDRKAFVPDLRTIGRSLARLYREVGDPDLLAHALAGARDAHERADGLKSMESATLLVEGLIEEDVDRVLTAVDAAREAERAFDLAEACAEAGAALLRRGDADAGRSFAMEAWAIYDDLGASRQEAVLAQDLRDLGVRRGSRGKRGRPSLGWDSLTQSERRVVDLVGEGLTNREIGTRLFVSKGTVATHLRNVFRKLEVTSRTELAAEAARRRD